MQRRRRLESHELSKKQTHFSKDECEKLVDLFRTLVTSNDFRFDITANNFASFSSSCSQSPLPTSSANLGCMERLLFKELLHEMFHIVTEDVLMDRIFNAFDKRNDGVIRVNEWIFGLSIFLRGTLDERISFSFFVYDLNGDGAITKDEIFVLLRNSILKLPHDEDPDDSIKDLTDLTLKKFDLDRDGKISWQDYQKAVQKDPLLVEALGQCFPPHEATIFASH